MPDNMSASPRREFLSGVASFGAVVGLADLATSAHAAETGNADASAAPGFAKWLDSIGGKHRQVLDAPEPNSGLPLIYAFVFLLTGPQAFAVPESELGLALVLRHNAIPMAFTDSSWSKYRLGEAFKVNDPVSGAPAQRNFFAGSKPGDLMVPEAAIDRLIARGVRVAVCGMSMMVNSRRVAKQLGLPAEEVHKEWIASLVPGSTVVPSGIVAVNGAQMRGCAYCFAG